MANNKPPVAIASARRTATLRFPREAGFHEEPRLRPNYRGLPAELTIRS